MQWKLVDVRGALEGKEPYGSISVQTEPNA